MLARDLKKYIKEMNDGQLIKLNMMIGIELSERREKSMRDVIKILAENNNEETEAN